MAYSISAELHGHQQDVRAVCALPGGGAATASRDRTVRLYTETNDLAGVVQGHPHFVSAVLAPSTSSSLLTGCQDGGVREFGLETVKSIVQQAKAAGEPLAPLEIPAAERVLEGHKEAVCALAVDEAHGRILSASWDKTVRVWDAATGTVQRVLQGHGQTVWGVIVTAQGQVVTASADKTIRVWDAATGACLSTMTGHSDCVRAIAELPNVGVVTAANDGLVKVWTMDGTCVHTLEGHNNFVYDVAVDPNTGIIASAGEDRAVRVWKDMECVAVLEHPQTVWSVAFLANGDLISGCADGVARVWTLDPARFASEETKAVYQASLAEAAAVSAAEHAKRLARLPTRDVLAHPGAKHGQHKIVQNNGKAEVHTWNANAQQWDYVGEVETLPDDGGGGGAAPSGGMINGKHYDYVFDVDLEDGAPHRKLGYNVGENPFIAAQEFIDREQLGQDNLEQIAAFIEQNTKRFEFGQEGISAQSQAGGAEIGGSSASSAPAPAAAPETFPTLPHFPKTAMLTFEAKTFDPVLAKLAAFNGDVGSELALSPGDVDQLTTMASTLLRKGFYHSTKLDPAALGVLDQVLFTWPADKLFPAIDLMRQAVMHPSGAEHYAPAPAIFDRLIAECLQSDKSKANTLMALRFMANGFARPATAAAVQQHVVVLAEVLPAMLTMDNTNVRVTAAALMSNISSKLARGASSPDALRVLAQCMTTAMEVLHRATETSDEVLYRTLVVLGTIVMLNASIAKLAKEMHARETVEALVAKLTTERTQACAALLLAHAL